MWTVGDIAPVLVSGNRLLGSDGRDFFAVLLVRRWKNADNLPQGLVCALEAHSRTLPTNPLYWSDSHDFCSRVGMQLVLVVGRPSGRTGEI